MKRLHVFHNSNGYLKICYNIYVLLFVFQVKWKSLHKKRQKKGFFDRGSALFWLQKVRFLWSSSFLLPISHCENFTLQNFYSTTLVESTLEFFQLFFHIVRRVSQQCSYHPPMDPISMFVKPLEKIHTSWKCLHFPILQSGFLYSLPQNFVVKGHFNEKSSDNPTNKDFPKHNCTYTPLQSNLMAKSILAQQVLTNDLSQFSKSQKPLLLLSTCWLFARLLMTF